MQNRPGGNFFEPHQAIQSHQQQQQQLTAAVGSRANHAVQRGESTAAVETVQPNAAVHGKQRVRNTTSTYRFRRLLVHVGAPPTFFVAVNDGLLLCNIEG